MGVLQQSFNQALTGATFLIQQTPGWKHGAEQWQLHRRLKTGDASKEDVERALTIKPGEKGVALKNQNLAIGVAGRMAVRDIQEEQQQKAIAKTETEHTRIIAQKEAIAKFQKMLKAQIQNPQKDILSPEEIKKGRLNK